MIRKTWSETVLKPWKSQQNNARFRSTSAGIQWEEVRIPMPWGHLAGKWWGPQNIRPFVAFHGWQDCCGTFDRLIPVLPKHLSYLALDFPGHGFSSRLPFGAFYEAIDSLLLIRNLQTYLKWEKVSLMGHSMGSIACFTFAGFYPSSVDLLVCLDGLSPLVGSKRLDRVTASIDAFLKKEKHASGFREPPAYAKDEMCEMTHKGSYGSIDLDKCGHVLERNIKPSKEHAGKFYFSHDPRVKVGPLMNWPVEDILEHSRRVQMPIFASLTDQIPAIIGRNHSNYERVKQILAKNPHFECHTVKGRHHAHLNTPELFREILGNFILKYDKEDRHTDRHVFDSIRL